jgi:hypothetical protein
MTDAFIPHSYGGQVHIVSDREPESERYRAILESIFEAMLRTLSKKIPISFILCANFDCAYDYGLCKAAKNLGMKSFVFYYEHYTIPYARNIAYSQYTYYPLFFVADRAALWSDLTRSIFDGVQGCVPSQIITTGPPRFDRWRDFDLMKPPEKHIVLMAYPGSEYFALLNFIDVIRILADKSKFYSDYTFWVKCKNSGQTCLTLDYLDGIPDHKLRVSHDFDLVELQSKAKIIIGFNSLSILESMLSNAALITPCWGDANLDPFLLQLDPNDELAQSVYNFPRSREDFSTLLDKLLRTSEEQILQDNLKNKSKREELFARYFFKDPNVPSSKLFEKMMLDTLEDSQK